MRAGVTYRVCVARAARLAWAMEIVNGLVKRWCGVRGAEAYVGEAFPYITPAAETHVVDKAEFDKWWQHVA